MLKKILIGFVVSFSFLSASVFAAETNTKIVTIKTSDTDLSSYVLYSKDYSTGFCWINAQNKEAVQMNLVSPHMAPMSTTISDPDCKYFDKASKNLKK